MSKRTIKLVKVWPHLRRTWNGDVVRSDMALQCGCGSYKIYDDDLFDYRKCKDCGREEGGLVEILKNAKKEKK